MSKRFAVLLGVSCAIFCGLPFYVGATQPEPGQGWGAAQWNAIDRSEPPKGMREQIVGPLEVSYARAQDEDGAVFLKVTVRNRSASELGHYALFFGRTVVAAPGRAYRASMRLSVERNGYQGSMGLGFHFMDDQGAYVTEEVPPTGNVDIFRTGVQNVAAEYMGGTLKGGVGGAVSQLMNRLTLSSVAPLAVVNVRIWRVDLQASGLPPVGLMPASATPLVAPGRVAKVTVPVVLGAPPAAGWVSRLRVQDAKGKVLWSKDKAWPKAWAKRLGLLRDPWLVKVPDTPMGERQTLTLLYQLIGRDGSIVPVQAMDGDVSETASGVREWRVGTLTLDRQGGMVIGSAFHHYPASAIGDSESMIGAVKLKFDFARSYGSDHGMVPWWSEAFGQLQLKWRAIDKWANYFSKGGQKSLLLVFSGTHASVSSQPNNKRNPLRLPGWNAPPRDMGLLTEAVEATVKHYGGRIAAVECWNEPTVPEFFAGTSKELADHCQAVYKGVKRLDPSIPVICPQTPSPELMGYVLQARTTTGERLTDYCDYFGAHLYKGVARDVLDQPVSAESLEDELQLLQMRLRDAGLAGKPIAVTEFGVDRCATHPARGGKGLDQLSAEQKSDILYSSMAALSEAGVRLLALYSYDLGGEPNACAIGGYLWLTNLDMSALNQPVLSRLNEAFDDFGQAIHR